MFCMIPVSDSLPAGSIWIQMVLDSVLVSYQHSEAKPVFKSTLGNEAGTPNKPPSL